MYYELRQFAGCFFNEDYQLEFASPDEAIIAFTVDQGAEAVARILPEIEQVLASALTEAELNDLWIMQLGARYDPTRDGRTYREWFTHVRDLLTDRAPD